MKTSIQWETTPSRIPGLVLLLHRYPGTQGYPGIRVLKYPGPGKCLALLAEIYLMQTPILQRTYCFQIRSSPIAENGCVAKTSKS
eukprot:1020670-Rhodomonas_salina.1